MTDDRPPHQEHARHLLRERCAGAAAASALLQQAPRALKRRLASLRRDPPGPAGARAPGAPMMETA